MKNPQDKQSPLSTADVAAAGRTITPPPPPEPLPGQDPMDTQPPVNAERTRPQPEPDNGAMAATPAPDGERPQPAPSRAADTPMVTLLEEAAAQSLRARWLDVQTGFVDEPRQAVEQADTLVAEVMQHLAQNFASARSQLEQQWSGGGDVSTEDLRQALRRYRTFFDRLLAV
jgi:hypothetical protein